MTRFNASWSYKEAFPTSQQTLGVATDIMSKFKLDSDERCAGTQAFDGMYLMGAGSEAGAPMLIETYLPGKSLILFPGSRIDVCRDHRPCPSLPHPDALC